jgi:pyrroloquinoline quinone biosynthesis protein B
MERLKAVVLGSAAGGGFPQWNCRCPVCRLAWAGDLRVRARTQTSIAVSIDGSRWVLLNAAPDLRTQIVATPALQPQAARVRDSPVEAVILTGGEVDEIAGLLHLRERQPLAVIGTAATLDTLAANSVFDALAPDVVERRRVAAGERFATAGIEV